MTKGQIVAAALVLMLAPAALRAQTAAGPQSAATVSDAPTLRDRLMPPPAAIALSTTPAPVVNDNRDERVIAQPAVAGNHSGTPYMLAGAALFVAGILVEGDAGTVLELAGAGIGAYGIYLYFR